MRHLAPTVHQRLYLPYSNNHISTIDFNSNTFASYNSFFLNIEAQARAGHPLDATYELLTAVTSLFPEFYLVFYYDGNDL